MDKRSTFIGLFLVLLGFGLMFWQSLKSPPPPPPPTEEAPAAPEAFPGGEAIAPASADELGRLVTAPDQLAVAPETEAVESTVTLENEVFAVTFTTRGAAVEQVLLKNYPDANPRVVDNPAPTVLNAEGPPALSLSRRVNDRLQVYEPLFTLVAQDAQSVTFATRLASGVEIVRSYRLVEAPEGVASYTIEHRTEVRNATEAAYDLGSLYFNIGTARPTHTDPYGMDLSASYRDNGDFERIDSSTFRGASFPFPRSPRELVVRTGTMQWAAVKNQFFTSILTPVTPGTSVFSTAVSFPPQRPGGEPDLGVTAAMEFALGTVSAGGTAVVEAKYYAGPKDFDLLSRMDQGQEDVMQLGWFVFFSHVGLIAFVAKVLLSLFGGIYSFIGNWGFTIILGTLVIRLVLYPLTLKAAKSSKRMQKLAKPLQELREKYKDDPKKLNEEMLALWRRHKVNPVSGCLPILLQFPIFIAMFNLLRNSSDLRFADFLWISDLSVPDRTIPLGDLYLPFTGNAINVLPFIWLVTMYYQMRLMPQPPTAGDNPAYKLMKWLPFIFFPFSYLFSSGLMIYWTTTNCFSILQQYLVNRTRDSEDASIEAEVAEVESHNKPKGLSANQPLISKKKKKKPEAGPGGLMGPR